MIYTPSPRPLAIDLRALAADRVQVTWFEPVSGQHLDGGVLAGRASVVLMSPLPQDAVLILDAVES